MILLRQNSKMELELPQIQRLSEQKFILLKDIIFLFKINEDSFYWLKTTVKETDTLRFYQFGTIIFRLPKIFQFASITAQHLVRWYNSNLYCGCCGNKLSLSNKERALLCNICKNTVYPVISPVVIVGVINQDKLLLTTYANNDFKQHGLIAGYVEIGETLESAVIREVKEEVGLFVKNIRYFASQHWGENHILIAGFFAGLLGEDCIKLDSNELSGAEWYSRHDLPKELSDISVTYETIEAFRNNKFG